MKKIRLTKLFFEKLKRDYDRVVQQLEYIKELSVDFEYSTKIDWNREINESRNKQKVLERLINNFCINRIQSASAHSSFFKSLHSLNRDIKNLHTYDLIKNELPSIFLCVDEDNVLKEIEFKASKLAELKDYSAESLLMHLLRNDSINLSNLIFKEIAKGKKEFSTDYLKKNLSKLNDNLASLIGYSNFECIVRSQMSIFDFEAISIYKFYEIEAALNVYKPHVCINKF